MNTPNRRRPPHPRGPAGLGLTAPRTGNIGVSGRESRAIVPPRKEPDMIVLGATGRAGIARWTRALRRPPETVPIKR